MLWDEYCDRYLTEPKTNLEYLWKEISPYVYHPSNEDIQWLIQALEDEQRKWFVAFIVERVVGSFPKRLKKTLFSPLIRAAVYELNPSLNRYFVEPCVAVFGYRQVNEALLELVEQGSNFEKAGAVNALYWAEFCFSSIKNAPKYTYATLESKSAYEALDDIWLRKQCLFGSPVIMVIIQAYNLTVSRFSAFFILKFVSSATFFTLTPKDPSVSVLAIPTSKFNPLPILPTRLPLTVT